MDFSLSFELALLEKLPPNEKISRSAAIG